MLSEELIELANKINKQKAEPQIHEAFRSHQHDDERALRRKAPRGGNPGFYL